MAEYIHAAVKALAEVTDETLTIATLDELFKLKRVSEGQTMKLTKPQVIAMKNFMNVWEDDSMATSIFRSDNEQNMDNFLHQNRLVTGQKRLS